MVPEIMIQALQGLCEVLKIRIVDRRLRRIRAKGRYDLCCHHLVVQCGVEMVENAQCEEESLIDLALVGSKLC